MKEVLQRPTDPYSPAWAMYWEQNPELHRGVGADGVNEGEEGGDGGDAGEGGEPQTKAPEGDGGEGSQQKPVSDSGEGKGDDNKPSDAEAKLLKEVMEKKGKLQDAQKELDSLKGELKKFEGIDLDQVNALLKEREEAKTKELEKKGEWDKLKAQMVDQHNAQLKELQEKLEAEQKDKSKLSSTINDLTIGHSFDASNFIKDDLSLTARKARIIYGNHFEVDDGKVVAYDKPASASDRTMLVDGSGNPLGFDAAIKKIVDADPDRDHIVKSKVKSGSDSKPKDKATPPKPELKGSSKIEAALNGGK